MRIGYTTGTFSDINPQHIELLKLYKKLLGPDSLLIVGLVTDELAVKQKRRPLLCYKYRRHILINFPFVDEVIEHTGDTKDVALEKIHFTDLFIGDDYYNIEEYKKMENKCKVHYIPSPLACEFKSTNYEIESLKHQIQFFKILKQSSNGMIFLYDIKPQPFVMKYIHISKREFQQKQTLKRTSNVFQLPIPPPRNYKKLGVEHQYANLPGINGFREIDIHKIIKDYPWCTNIRIIKNFEFKENKIKEEQFKQKSDFSNINQEKSDAQEIYCIQQLHIEDTLDSFIQKHKRNPKIIDTLKKLIQDLKKIHEDLKKEFIVHGDFHPFNICVSTNQHKSKCVTVSNELNHEINNKIEKHEAIGDFKLYLIDFGWCIHRSFHMEPDEKEYYEQCLEKDWDWQHFLDSMEYYYHQHPWYSAVFGNGGSFTYNDSLF